MGYKSELQSNNTDLQSILDMINALGLVDAPSITLITFTINDISYQAEQGMTWAEWAESEYNTDSVYENAQSIFTSDWMTSINKTDGSANTILIEDGMSYITM